MTSSSVKLEITVCGELFMWLPGSPIVSLRHCMSDQPPEMTSMPWFPVPQVWCSWLVTCMLWAGLTAHCACGQWMYMMVWRTSGRPSPACRSAGALWVRPCSMTCSTPWGALMAVLVGLGCGPHSSQPGTCSQCNPGLLSQFLGQPSVHP